MKKFSIIAGLKLLVPLFGHSQSAIALKDSTTLNFISDTQQPMWVEKFMFKPNHNTKATALLFNRILENRPKSLFMLGDVVCLGFNNKKWKNVDCFLDSCRKDGTNVYGLLGNHDVMGKRKKGESNFQKRFPDNVRTGYYTVTDSVAVVMLNSNFNTLSQKSVDKQNTWYRETMAALDSNEAVKAVIVTCHHAPYSHSKVAKSSAQVQNNFVEPYIASKKARLFITGHAHVFEHFKIKGKDFLVIGGGGGLHQPLVPNKELVDLSDTYKPQFHYLSVKRMGSELKVQSHFLKDSFDGFGDEHAFETTVPVTITKSSEALTTK